MVSVKNIFVEHIIQFISRVAAFQMTYILSKSFKHMAASENDEYLATLNYSG